MKLGELLKMKTTEERAALCPGTPCADCGVRLQGAITGRQQTAYGELCDDCYYERIGDLVEEFPIGIPRMHRGA